MKLTSATRSMVERLLCEEHRAVCERLPGAETRAEKLGTYGHTYEAETEDPTPEEEKRLDRIITLSNRARSAVENLQERADLIASAISALEDERARRG